MTPGQGIVGLGTGSAIAILDGSSTTAVWEPVALPPGVALAVGVGDRGSYESA